MSGSQCRLRGIRVEYMSADTGPPAPGRSSATVRAPRGLDLVRRAKAPHPSGG